MSQHTATIRWTRTGPDFAKGKYSRKHTWRFDGGLAVPASPAPSVVPAPWSNAASEKLLEVDFKDGTPMLHGDQFGLGRVSTPVRRVIPQM